MADVASVLHFIADVFNTALDEDVLKNIDPEIIDRFKEVVDSQDDTNVCSAVTRALKLWIEKKRKDKIELSISKLVEDAKTKAESKNCKADENTSQSTST